MGGDEFFITLLSSDIELSRRITNLKTYLARFKGKYVKGISVAIGCVKADDYPESNLQEICKLADDSMYKDKNEYYKKTGNERRQSD